MTTQSDTHPLSELALFRGLTPGQLTRLSSYLHRITFPAGTNIMAAEQPGEAVYIILSGTVKVHLEQLDGSSVILAVLGSGDVVGEMSLLDSGGRSANVITSDECTCLWLARHVLQECMQRMPALANNLMFILSSRLRWANEQIQALATLNVHGRVARQILALAQRHGQVTAGGDVHIPIRLTQNDIGHMVGASRERVNGVISVYRRNQYISVDRDCRITVHDSQALAQTCQWPNYLEPTRDHVGPLCDRFHTPFVTSSALDT